MGLDDGFLQFLSNLKCMRGVGLVNIPTFKFFTFKVSYIYDKLNNQDQVMLCFADISQKILADSSKAEGEFLSLINSTISHEMRNPLNSIINQCKIMAIVIQTFKPLLEQIMTKILPALRE